MAEQEPLVCKSGTVTEIINDGKDGGPWQAMMTDMDGGSPMLVSASQPIGARVGDKLAGTGVYKENVLPSLPCSFTLPEGVPLANRMRGMMGDGATVLSNPQSAGDAASRPGLVAMASTTGADQPVMAMASDTPGVTIVQGYNDARRSETFMWAKELIGQVPGNDMIAIVDPHAFSPSELSVGKREADLKTVGDSVRAALPEDMDDMVPVGGDKESKIQKQSPFAGFDDNAGDMVRKARRSIVMPFNPYQTGHAFALGMSGLGSSHFMPKRHASVEVRQGYVMAHELAHSVQHRYGLANNKAEVSVTNAKECFADSFSMLANAQRLGSTEQLQDFALYRHAKGLSGSLSHATGPACDAALAKADELLASGELQNMTADDMLKMAAEISNEHSLSNEQVEAITKDRASQYGGIEGVRRLRKGGVLDSAGGQTLVETVESYDQIGILDGPSADMLRKGAAAVRSLAYSRDDIDATVSKQQLWDAYGKDLNETVGSLKKNGGAPRLLTQAEQGTFKPPAEGASPKNVGQVFGRQLQKVEQKITGNSGLDVNWRNQADTGQLVSIVQTKGPNPHIRRALAVDPAQRYQDYLGILGAEAAGTDYKGVGGDDLVTARASYAYAILADPNSAEFVKNRGGMDAMLHLRRASSPLDGSNVAKWSEISDDVGMMRSLVHGKGQPARELNA
ncbi:MAG: hypothetical protein Alpg2KO_06580 [Alphaproteobacteria bacterium]